MDWMSKCDYHLGEHQEAIMLSDGLFESNRHYGGIYEPIADSYEQALGELERARVQPPATTRCGGDHCAPTMRLRVLAIWHGR